MYDDSLPYDRCTLTSGTCGLPWSIAVEDFPSLGLPEFMLFAHALMVIYVYKTLKKTLQPCWLCTCMKSRAVRLALSAGSVGFYSHLD